MLRVVRSGAVVPLYGTRKLRYDVPFPPPELQAAPDGGVRLNEVADANPVPVTLIVATPWLTVGADDAEAAKVRSTPPMIREAAAAPYMTRDQRCLPSGFRTFT
jgi:hypothetical protein